MDGRGICLDNHWIERYWRSLKIEFIFICPQDGVEDLKDGIGRYIDYYNIDSLNQGINNCRPRDRYEDAA